jgi:hypothetical protein
MTSSSISCSAGSSFASVQATTWCADSMPSELAVLVPMLVTVLVGQLVDARALLVPAGMNMAAFLLVPMLVMLVMLVILLDPASLTS